jgi:hypothetical protein
MATTAMNQKVNDARRNVEKAVDAVAREDWELAEMALLEAQDRIGRMLREIELKRSSSRIFEPPSPIRNAPD